MKRKRKQNDEMSLFLIKTKGGKLELNLTSLLFVRRSLETDNERFVLMMLSSVGEWWE